MSIPAPAQNTVFTIRIDGLLNGTECANVIAVRDDIGTQTPQNVANATEGIFAAALASALGITYQNVISDGRTWTNLHVVRYNAADPDVHDEPLSGTDFQGNNPNNDLPPQVAMCITLRTGVASRRARGRLFDYGFTEEAITATGRIDSVERNAVEAFWQDILSRFTAHTDVTWGVLSKGWINEGAQDPRQSYAQNFYPITSALIRDVTFDTMRSRVA